MFDEKPKRKVNVFQAELLDGEELLWSGQSDKNRLFTGQDLFLIPFSLLWCAITVPLLLGGLASGNIIFVLMPHGWIGLYMLFGRFIVKYQQKKHTYYAVTNHRILIVSGLFSRRLQTFSLRNLPSLEKRMGRDGVGTIIFAELQSKSWWNRSRTSYSNTGMEIFGQGPAGFYDIHDVDDVYRIIAQLAHQTQNEWVEKPKPSFLPH